MKAIAEQKLFEQYNQVLDYAELREHWKASVSAWIAGFHQWGKDTACPYPGELGERWEIGRAEAGERFGQL